MEFIEIIQVSKTYRESGIVTTVLEDISLKMNRSDYRCLMGASGSGKTTLLNLISGLDRPTTGTIRIHGLDLSPLSESELSEWRKKMIGLEWLYRLVLTPSRWRRMLKIPIFISLTFTEWIHTFRHPFWKKILNSTNPINVVWQIPLVNPNLKRF